MVRSSFELSFIDMLWLGRSAIESSGSGLLGLRLPLTG
jgi:hypothetical protein